MELAQPEDDCVVIAGKGNETVQILGHEEVELNDKQVVLDFCQQNSLLAQQRLMWVILEGILGFRKGLNTQ